MTRFIDGPAAGVELWLRRAPFFLRAVRTPAGEWDALDQPDDTAKPEETIVVYQLAGEPSYTHIRASRGRGGVFWGGEYRVAANPPPDQVARDTAAWREWAGAEGAKRVADPVGP